MKFRVNSSIHISYIKIFQFIDQKIFSNFLKRIILLGLGYSQNENLDRRYYETEGVDKRYYESNYNKEEEEDYAPKPFSYEYGGADHDGRHFAKTESKDEDGVVKGWSRILHFIENIVSY